MSVVQASKQNEDQEESLRALFVEAQAGDKEKYREFLEGLQPRLKRYLLRALPSESLAEDCLQEILLSIHRVRHTYDKDRPLLAWVRAITRNKIIDFYRAGARRKAAEVSNPELVEQGISSNNAANQLEHRDLLQKLLSSLPEEFQKPLMLTKVEGFSVADTAKKLGISESLVKVRVHRATRKLQAAIEQDELLAL